MAYRKIDLCSICKGIPPFCKNPHVPCGCDEYCPWLLHELAHDFEQIIQDNE